MPTRIIALRIMDRIKEAGKTQAVLSRHAASIQSRLGFHELSKDKCSRTGIIMLHLRGDAANWDILEKELNEIGGVQLKSIQFDN